MNLKLTNFKQPKIIYIRHTQSTWILSNENESMRTPALIGSRVPWCHPLSAVSLEKRKKDCCDEERNLRQNIPGHFEDIIFLLRLF